MFNLHYFLIIAFMCFPISYVLTNTSTNNTNSKGMNISPVDFVIDLILDYLDIHDVVLAVHENTSINAEEYSRVLYENEVLNSIFQWNDEEPEPQQFSNFIRVVDSGKHQTLVFFLDANITEKFLKHAHQVRAMLHNPCYYRWIFFKMNDVNMNSLRHFNGSTVCWRALYVTRRNKKGDDTFRLSVIGPNMDKDGHCVLRDKVAEWTPSTGIHEIHPSERILHDFSGKVFETTFVNVPPFYSLSRDGKSYEGIEYELIQTLQETLNFKVQAIKNYDGEYGRRLPNGTWTGYIGLVSNGRVIFAVATLSMRTSRMEVIDFSSPYFFNKLSFVVLNPALEGRKLVLIMPMKPKIWIALVCALILSSCALYAITHFLPTKHIIQDNYNFWFLLGTFGGEACSYPAPPYHSLRFFISFWWFFVITITACYSGTLTYFMSYPGRRPAIDTVPKLQRALISKSLYYGTLRGTAYASFLMTDMAKVHPIFRDNLLENPENLVDDGMTGMNLVLKGRYAFVYIKMILKWFTAIMGQDRFYLSKDVFSTDYIGAAIQKCHPCKESFDHIISRLEETGFFTKWYDDAFTKATILAPHVNVGGARALSIDDLQGAFYLLGIGAGIGFISLLLEVLVRILQGKKLKKKIFKPKKKMKKQKKIYPIIFLRINSKSKLGEI